MENHNFRQRLHAVIPGGAHTYSRGDDQFPSNAPAILERGKGAYVWDPNDNKFLDYGMALRAVTLGYDYPPVSAAVVEEIHKGNNLTRASMTELEAAELLVDTIPSAEMVKFAKNGSNVTTAAAKIARAFTGRKYICVPRQHPFFSFDDWFIGTTAITKGIPKSHIKNTLIFDYGDVESLKSLFGEYQDQIAGVMMEPATTILPCLGKCTDGKTQDDPCSNCEYHSTNFLSQVQDICRKNGSLFILDEMITGFRWQLEGAQTYYGVEPDLSTFGKGMANGFSVAALTGKKEIMKMGSINELDNERTFLLSTTHGAEMSSLRAFIETVKVYKQENVCSHLWDYGHRLREGIRTITEDLGISNNFYLEGSDILMNYVAKDTNGKISLELKTLFSQEMIANGVLMPWVAISLSHKENELDRTVSAARIALAHCSSALNDGIHKYLNGPALKPVFRKYN